MRVPGRTHCSANDSGSGVGIALTLQPGPERALVGLFERGDDAIAIGLQRHSLARSPPDRKPAGPNRVSPSRRTDSSNRSSGPTARCWSDSAGAHRPYRTGTAAPANDPRRLGSAPRATAPAQAHRDRRTHRSTRLGGGERIRKPVGHACEQLRRSSPPNTPAAHCRRSDPADTARRPRRHWVRMPGRAVRIVRGVDGAPANELQRGEEVELVGRRADHYRHLGRPPLRRACQRIDRKRRRSRHRPTQLFGADAVIQHRPLQPLRRQRTQAIPRGRGIAAARLGRVPLTGILRGRQLVLQPGTGHSG